MDRGPRRTSQELILRTVGRNTLYEYAMMGWTLFLGFLATPAILQILGNERYGIWSVALSAFGTATFFDLGLGSALVLWVADKRAREREEEVSEIIHSAMTLYLFFGLVGGTLFLGGSRFIVYDLLKVSPEFRGLATSILSVYGFLFMIQMPAKVYEDVLIGIQRLDIKNKAGICIRTMERLLVLFLLFKGVDLLGVVWVSGILSLLLYGIEFFFVKRLLPEYRLKLCFKKKDVKDLFATGGQQFIASLGYIFLGVIDRFLLGTLLHVSTVTFYDLASRPSQLLYQLSLRVFHPIYPASTELQALKEKEKLQTLFKKGTKIIFVLLIPLSMAVFLWSKEIIHFWVGSGYELSGQMLQPLTVTYFILSLNVIPNAMMFGLNKASLVAWESFLRIFLNFCFGVFFIHRIGPLGAAYGLCLSSFITTVIFFWLIAGKMGFRRKTLFGEVLFYPILFVFLGSAFFFVGSLLSLSKGLCFVIFTLFFMVVSSAFYLGRRDSMSLIQAIFARSR